MRRLCAALLGASLLVASAGCAKTDNHDDDDTVDARITADAGNGQCDFCSTSDECCNGFCVDVQSNQLHCGECNHGCVAPTADGCSLGHCTCNFGTECSGAAKCCPGIGCKDTQTDKLNCGACGIPCPDPDNQSCVTGLCVCAATGGACEGATPNCCSTGCANTQTDPQNCGTCGHVCGGSANCEGGECVYTCEVECAPPLEICCSAGCTIAMTDPLNCGACDVVCPSGLCLGSCL